jgi:hypothetical protein
LVIAKPDHLSHKPGFVATLMWSGVEFAIRQQLSIHILATSRQGARDAPTGAVQRMRAARRAQAAQFAANVLPIIRDVQAAGRASLNRRAAQCPEARMAMLDE